MNEKRTNIKEITLIGLMAAILCVVAPFSIPIPFSVVPISFTNLAIYFAVFILGWKKGTISYLIYFLLGFVGLPVFSGFSGGPAKVFGPTGGYLIGFIILAIISGYFIEKFKGKVYMYVVGMSLGLVVTYILGTTWLSYQLELTFIKGLMMGVVPYLPGDILKIVIATIVGPTLRKTLSNKVTN